MGIDRLDPKLAALVVIDVQNDFCSPNGVAAKSGHDVSGAVEMAPRLGALLVGARSVGVPIVLVRTEHSDETTTDPWRFRSGEREKTPNCVPGSWGAEFYEIQPQDGDHVVTKYRYSAFNSPEFVRAISKLGRPSLLFCGVATNVCVETTLRDATCADYYSTLIEDCSSGYSKELHLSTVKNVRNNFGLVSTSEEILKRWRS